MNSQWRAVIKSMFYVDKKNYTFVKRLRNGRLEEYPYMEKFSYLKIITRPEDIVN